MSRLRLKSNSAIRRQHRVRAKVKGTSARPRLSVNVSNRHISAQIIDDTKNQTIVGISSVSINTKGSLTVMAEKVGTSIAKLAKSKKIKQVSFDRGSKLYHGRIKTLADAARKEGLEI